MRTQQHMIAEFVNYGDKPSLSDARAIAQVAVDAFLKGEVDVVYLVYAKFVNTVTQQPTAVQLLPVQPPAEEDKTNRRPSNTSTNQMPAASSRPCCHATWMCWSIRPCWRR